MECKCKFCSSENTIKKGVRYGKQSYRCKDCGRYFVMGDRRLKRDPKQKELCLILYCSGSSMRSIQSTIEKFFDTKISFRLIEEWIKSFVKSLKQELEKQEKQKPRTIEILELDELYSHFYDLKKTPREC
jgi:transposase-like protein